MTTKSASHPGNGSSPRNLFILLGFLGMFTATGLLAAVDYPVPEAGNYSIQDFRFQTGEVLPELRIHYRTLGTPRRDDHGIVTNAVLILHVTTGNGSNFLRPDFAGELFGEGQLLDAA